jgi:hypothetical protein
VGARIAENRPHTLFVMPNMPPGLIVFPGMLDVEDATGRNDDGKISR